MNEINTTTSNSRSGGIYCGYCGTKMYLSADGSHRRCPNCDDCPDSIKGETINKI